ncbi:hypothetical protein BGZ93_002603 [Podila epicladia]|nr:hypothetical protein BGZ92_000495 [Podila epicladia]KAG0097499.1 hypothetical protein BGZ93_002603 [Podila epicladia]
MQRAPSTFARITCQLSSHAATSGRLAMSMARPLSSSSTNNTLLLAHSRRSIPQTMLMSATCPFRGYASKKNDKKGGKGGKKSSDDDDEDSGSRGGKGGKGGKTAGGAAPAEMSFDPLDLEKKMGQCLERLKRDFMTMRAGTANPAILDPVMVKIEGKMVPLRDLAQVAIKDAKTLMVNVNDVELTSAIEKAIREAGLNLNPIADNKAVRVPVPKPTKEFRESLTKLAAASTEKAKTIIRKLRQDGMKELKKDLKAGMSEDENYTLEKKAQTLHDKYIKDAEEALKAKTKEIMAN